MVMEYVEGETVADKLHLEGISEALWLILYVYVCRRRLCDAAEEHWRSAGGYGSHVLRRNGSSVGVSAQLRHRAPGPQT